MDTRVLHLSFDEKKVHPLRWMNSNVIFLQQLYVRGEAHRRFIRGTFHVLALQSFPNAKQSMRERRVRALCSHARSRHEQRSYVSRILIFEKRKMDPSAATKRSKRVR